ncbi:MAG: hypothetical protein OEV92_02660 [Nitrospinota bacterium]|nr:hypothetical protein [Nitrospinota bacterium]
MAADKSPRDFLKVRGDFIDCPHCGCPNRPTDHTCSYCSKQLFEKPGVSSKIRKAVETMKWRYKLQPGVRSSARGVAAPIFTILLGLSLMGVGGYFLLQGYLAASVSRFLIGAIFAGYGGYAVAFVLKLTGK